MRESKINFIPIFILNHYIEKLIEWEGVIFIKDGIYKNGIFKFFISIPQNYPDAAPKLFFKSKIYNSRIDSETGELDIKVNQN